MISSYHKKATKPINYKMPTRELNQFIFPLTGHYNINENLTKEAPKVPMSSFKSTSNRDVMYSESKVSPMSL